jgi:hypothetical protein
MDTIDTVTTRTKRGKMQTQTQTTPTKADRLLQALRSSTAQTYGMTTKQIATRFKVANPRDLVHRLRKNGHNIVREESISSKGISRQKYFLD